ncbi:TetR/AcrR family transcriptional regulator [Mycolicibacterium farcinogenes]|nr:TetR/AcrR family transcriptional regulator [Mycolicibacterium farcinogenes]
MPLSALSNADGRRSPAWSADLPVDEADARSRLLDAAEQCYAEFGPSRTKMAHIATRAGIHRTTIYSYFRNRDEVLTACYLRAASIVLDAAEACWTTDSPFIDQLVDACVVGISVARDLPALRVLIDRNELPYAQTVAAASDAWRNRLYEAFGRRLAVAAAAGAVRTDVTAETQAQWVVRICISLTVEPGRPEDGGDRGVLQAFLPRCVMPS